MWFGEVLLLLLFLNSGSHPLPLSLSLGLPVKREEEEKRREEKRREQQRQQQKKMGKTFVPRRSSTVSVSVSVVVCLRALREQKDTIQYGICPGNLSASKTFQRRGRTTG